jgi:N-methylhydantoinase A
MANIPIAVDIGGTLTDIVAQPPEGATEILKVSATPEDPSIAVIDGVKRLLRSLELNLSQVGEIVHGTTVGRAPRETTRRPTP